MILVDFGLLVDALLINLGGFFDGGLPEPVSRLRFILHGMLIPLLFPHLRLCLEAKAQGHERDLGSHSYCNGIGTRRGHEHNA